MRPAIKAIIVAGAIVISASALQQRSQASLSPAILDEAYEPSLAVVLLNNAYKASLPPVLGYLAYQASQPSSQAVPPYRPMFTPPIYGEQSQSLAFGYLPPIKSYLDPSQVVALSGSAPVQVPERSEPAPGRIERVSLGIPRAVMPTPQPKFPVVRIQFESSVLAPFAHTVFCLKYRDECKVRKMVFRGGPVKLTAERWAELVRINTRVNRAIIPEPNMQGLAAEKWLISPNAGECHDYAVTKRHELIARGWPARNLLLAEVVIASGEHHLVLVVRTNEGDFIADNLNANIRNWTKAPYQWVRVQSSANPMFWSTVTRKTIWAKGTRLTNADS